MDTDGRIKGDRQTLEFVGNVRDKKVLDIGCSDCLFADMLGVDKEDYCGIEYNEKSISIARRKGYNIKKYDLESGKIPFKNGCFDVVIAKDIIEHLHSFVSIVKEINRVLKPGGKAFVCVPSEWSYFLWNDYTHKRAFTPHSIKQLFVDNGFGIKRIKNYRYIITSKSEYVGKLLLRKLTGLDFITQNYMAEFIKIRDL